MDNMFTAEGLLAHYRGQASEFISDAIIAAALVQYKIGSDRIRAKLWLAAGELGNVLQFALVSVQKGTVTCINTATGEQYSFFSQNLARLIASKTGCAKQALQ